MTRDRAVCWRAATLGVFQLMAPDALAAQAHEPEEPEHISAVLEAYRPLVRTLAVAN